MDIDRKENVFRSYIALKNMRHSVKSMFCFLFYFLFREKTLTLGGLHSQRSLAVLISMVFVCLFDHRPFSHTTLFIDRLQSTVAGLHRFTYLQIDVSLLEEFLLMCFLQWDPHAECTGIHFTESSSFSCSKPIDP